MSISEWTPLETTTRLPVVLIHGAFGHGRDHPLWGRGGSYWPEDVLDELNPNHIVVDVGVLSSNHDRACEVFYQLKGGRVDYGEEHSTAAGHDRFGVKFTSPLLEQWGPDHPVHLVGHSLGATTAIELYQMLCDDFFGVGSDHTWVRSLSSIAGPLAGSTFPHAAGLNTPQVPRWSFAHVAGAALSLWLKLHSNSSWVRGAWKFRMPQWETHSVRDLISENGTVNSSNDLGVFNLLPKVRMERNARLVHMDKLFLISVATSDRYRLPIVELSLAGVITILAGFAKITRSRRVAALAAGLALWLYRRLRAFDLSTSPSLVLGQAFMQHGANRLNPDYDVADRETWSANDGAVNLRSMVAPWPAPMASDSDTESTASTTSSVDEDEPQPKRGVRPPKVEQRVLDASTVASTEWRRGTWYAHQVTKNHLASTQWDRDASQLFGALFRIMAHHFEVEVNP